MAHDKDERKRPHLRLVVDNVEKRNARPAAGEELFIPLEELVAQRDEMRPLFYRGMERRHAKAYEAAERYLSNRKLPYGFDPQHGPLLVLPAGAVCPEAIDPGAAHQDEILLYVTEDSTGDGLCLSLEMILPFYSEEEAVMEDALLFSPVFQYGTLFLEENRQDGLLDLIYRLGFPIYPPALTARVLDRLLAIVAFELKETLRNLAEYQEGT
ncbi:MAG TPA: hypothetical protein VI298_00035 [Geobacteraceae bacterium]